MKPILRIISIFTSLFFAGCGNGEFPSGDIVTLDLEAAIDNRLTFDLTEIVETISLVPLDDGRREALVGAIVTIAESKNRFYVADKTDFPVKVFDRDGKFIATRGRIGRGPDEFLSVNYMVTDWENENIYLSVYNGTAMYPVKAYGADGDIFARNDSIPRGKFACFDGKVFLFNAPRGEQESDVTFTFMERYSPELRRETVLDVANKGSGDVVMVTTTDGQPINATTLNISNISVIDMAPVIVSGNGASLLAKQGRSDTVYHYIDGALKPVWRLDFGNYAIPDETFGLHTNSIASWDNRYAIENIYEGDRYILVTQRLGAGRLLFDRRENYAGFSAIGPNGYEGLFLGGVKFNPMYIRYNRLVGYMQAIDIVDNAASITNPDLKTLAATLREDSNPVIVVAKLKE